MAFNSFGDFLAMGHHGFYVWMSYGLTGLILLWLWLQPALRQRAWLKEQLQRLRRADQGQQHPHHRP